MTRLAVVARLLTGIVLLPALVACGETAGGLAPGLTASMEQPGATLDRASAIGIVNQYRATVGASALTGDPSLDAEAADLAQSYSRTGKAPALPANAVGLRTSAGYPSFAETFSGWRNSPGDAAILAGASAHRAGLASFYDPGSAYGVYWVLLLAG